MTIAAGQKMYADDILNLTFFPIGTILQFSGGQYSRLTSARTVDNKVVWTLCDGTSVNEIAVPNLVDKFLRGSSASGASGGANSQSVTLASANLPSHSHAATGLSLGNLSTSGLTVNQGGAHGHTGNGTAENENPVHTHTFSGTAATGTLALVTGGCIQASGVFDNSSSRRANHISAGIVGEDNGVNFSMTPSGSVTGGTHSHKVSVTIPESGSHSHTISGSITGGNITGTTANTGSGQAFSVSTLPAYYTVVYIMKVA
jgi:hypothetical protein